MAGKFSAQKLFSQLTTTQLKTLGEAFGPLHPLLRAKHAIHFHQSYKCLTPPLE
jgi:hypothetical protein